MWNFWALPLSFAVVLAATIGARAQAYPNQAVRVVVPFSPGSISDNLARIVADKKQRTYRKQDVIVENRPGPPGTTSVAKSAPDKRIHTDADVQRSHRRDRRQQGYPV